MLTIQSIARFSGADVQAEDDVWTEDDVQAEDDVRAEDDGERLE